MTTAAAIIEIKVNYINFGFENRRSNSLTNSIS